LKAAFYSYLPTGGAIRVAGHQLFHLRDRFGWTAHLPRGGEPPRPDSGVETRHHPFPQGRRLLGARRLLAPLLLWRKSMAYSRLCARIAGEMEAEGDAVLLAHTSLIVSSPPLLSAASMPSVYYCHEYPRYIYEKGLHKTGSALTDLLILPLLRWERRVDRKAARDASVLATNSRYMAGKLRGIYGREAVPVPPGVDTEMFTPGNGRGRFVLTVGALSPYKRHGLALEALALLPPGLRPPMVTVGDRGSGSYAAELEALAADRGVELTVMQSVSDAKLIDLYRTASVVVCPQRLEPYGLVPLEAMACGTPVVAVDQGGFSENVPHGIAGYLVEVSAEAMAERIGALLDSPKAVESMGSAGRSYVVARRSSRGEADTVAGLMEGAAGG